MDELMKQEIRQLCCEVLFDEPMSRHTSIKVGGVADAVIYPKNIEEIKGLLKYARAKKLPYIIVGSGTNLLVRDKGIRGLVISLARGFSNIRIEEPNGLFVEAGVGIPRLVDFAAEKGFSGIEPLAGVPGNLGGALTMNAGTREGEIGQITDSVTFLDRDGRLVTWKREKIRFGYRESHFPAGSVILSARLSLKQSTPEAVRAKVKADREKRAQSQPLNYPNLGSIFKNPKKGYAGALIEESGLKDVRIGGARVSPKHANFIINEGTATARDILMLMGLIRDKVKEKFGILLEPEVRVVGEE